MEVEVGRKRKLYVKPRDKRYECVQQAYERLQIVCSLNIYGSEFVAASKQSITF